MKNPKLVRNWIIAVFMMIPLILAIVYPHSPFPFLVGVLSVVMAFIPISKLK